MSDLPAHIYEFSDFRFDIVRRELRRNGEAISLTPKVLDTLRVLVQNHGQVVTKDKLMEDIWGDSFVEESGLLRNISVLRKALGEQDGDLPFIVTVPRQGYRFLAKVTTSGAVSGEVTVREQVRTRIVVEETKIEDEIRTLAVLPFKLIGGDASTSHMGLGMADALITKLSNIRKLRVRPTSAIIKYNDGMHDPLQAAEELDVESVIEGSIWQKGESVRINVQLVDRRRDAAQWAATFDENIANTFAVQDAISEKVAFALEFQLSSGERRRLAKRGTADLEAYRLFARALFLMHQFTPTHTGAAMPILEEAIERDPNFAMAHAYLTGCHLQKASFNVALAAEVEPIVRPLAQKTLGLDPELPAAHYAQAFVHLFLDWDMEKAEACFVKAVELNPNDATSSKHYGMYLFGAGRFDEGIEQAKKTRSLDPVTPSNTSHVGMAYYYAGRYEESIAWHRIALEMDPQFVNANIGLGWSLSKLGAHAEALAAIEQLIKISALPPGPNALAARGYVSATAGDKKLAASVLERLKDQSIGKFVSPIDMAAIHAALGDVDKAVSWLDRALAERSVWLIYLKIDPRFENLFAEPEFVKILGRICPGAN